MPLIRIRPAFPLTIVASVLLMASGGILLLSSLCWVGKLSCLLIIAYRGQLYFRKQIILTHPLSIVALSKSSAAFWTLQLANKPVMYGVLRSNSLVSNFLLVLRFKCVNNKKLTCILIPDSIGFQAYRTLLVNLRHEE